MSKLIFTKFEISMNGTLNNDLLQKKKDSKLMSQKSCIKVKKVQTLMYYSKIGE